MNTNTAPGAGTFPWTAAELAEELAETREAWRVPRANGLPTAAIERTGIRLAAELQAARENGGWILL